MSEENKDLRDDLEDMLGSAKEASRKVARKAEEFGKEAQEKAKQFTDRASEEAKEFAGKAKHEASEFSEDAKEILSDGKNVAIIAHLTIVGWVIALLMNNTNKNEFASFYLRQVLGIMLLAVVLSWIPILNVLAGLVLLIMWIMSLVSAINGEMKPVFLLGDRFQEWFKSL